jgi:predicted CXXCH cytochrome family protein
MRSACRGASIRLSVLIGLLPLLMGGCTDEKIVFREPFNPPPDAASGFLGYFTTSDQQTTCGNCHVDHQNKWVGTAHADAYATLVNSGNDQDFCYRCHTVSENGNQVQSAAGWSTVQDTAYHDVQCESCHGPGAEHVETPDASDHPLARVRVLTADIHTGNIDTDTATAAGSCAECHSGAHHPFVDEWRESAHGRALYEEEGAIFIADESPSCAPCHEGRAVLRAWGVTTNYFERDSAAGAAGPHLGVTCAICHDPHNAQNEGQLRFPITSPRFDENLCMKCHSRRYEPAPTSSRGPHAPQGAVLTGTAGWWPPGYDTTAVAATHGTPEANPRLCAGCHVNSFEVEDRLNPGETILSTGHSFRPVPCLDPTSGEPTQDNSCGYTEAERYWGGCTTSGCHVGGAAAVALALNTQRGEIEFLADELWNDADGDTVLFTTNPDGSFLAFDPGDTGLLTEIADPATAFTTADLQISVAEGALFNLRLVGEARYANGDRSKGVHNPFLSPALLVASLNAVQTTYFTPVVRLSPEAQGIVDRINAKLLRGRAPSPISSR